MVACGCVIVEKKVWRMLQGGETSNDTIVGENHMEEDTFGRAGVPTLEDTIVEIQAVTKTKIFRFALIYSIIMKV